MAAVLTKVSEDRTTRKAGVALIWPISSALEAALINGPHYIAEDLARSLRTVAFL